MNADDRLSITVIEGVLHTYDDSTECIPGASEPDNVDRMITLRGKQSFNYS